jgi:flagellar hook-associated protein 2
MYTDSYNGVIKTKTDSLQKTVDDLAGQITKLEEQLERERASLYQQFQAMEDSLSKLRSSQQYLTAIFGDGSATGTKSGATSSSSS